MKRLFYILCAFSIAIGGFSCDQASKPPQRDVDQKEIAETIEKANKYLLRTEQEQIENYIRRHQLVMLETGTGLRYQIDDEGFGNKIVKGQWVKLHYTSRLINGDIVYQSAIDGIKQFQVGKGGVETGLEEGILLLRKGSTAKIILPSHLAFGLLGDQKKIPPRSTLIYEIEVIDVQ